MNGNQFKDPNPANKLVSDIFIILLSNRRKQVGSFMKSFVYPQSINPDWKGYVDEYPAMTGVI